MSQLSVAETTALFAQIENLSDSVRAKLARRIYLFEAKDLISIGQEGEGRKDVRLDLETVCAVRVYSVLIDLGFDNQTLVDVRQAFNTVDPDFDENPDHATDLQTAIEAARAGKTFDLLLSLTHSAAAGTKSLSVKFDGLHPSGVGRAARTLAMLNAANGISTQATVRIPAADLLRPVIEAFAEA